MTQPPAAMRDGFAMLNGMLCDFSDYDMGTWEPACFRSAGVTKAITNSFRKSNAITRIQTLRAAGIEVVGVYGFCYFGPDPYYVNRDVDAAIELAQAFDIPMVWVDAELDACGIGGLGHLRPSEPKERIEQLRAAVRKVEAAGLPVGIYTAGWWWWSNMAGSTEFAKYPLWHAEYGNNDGKRPPVTHVSYGGWSEVTLHQYTSNKLLCGRARDHNYELRSVAAQQTEEDEMTPEERARLERVEKILAGNGIAQIAPDGSIVRKPDGTPVLLFGEDALGLLARNGNSMWLAHQLQNEALRALEQRDTAGGIGNGARVTITGIIEEES